MDVREKLVEIIQNSVGGCARHWAEVIADGLIANGVTVQGATNNNVGDKPSPTADTLSANETWWISVKDRLPTIYDADDDNCVLAIHKASNKRYYHWRSVADNPFDFTHWMKMPQPPKGE